MKRLILVLLVLVVASSQGYGLGLNPYTENFDGPTFPPDGFIIYNGSFNGAGQYVLEENDMIIRYIPGGDFTIDFSYSSIDMGPNPLDTGGFGTWMNYLLYDLASGYVLMVMVQNSPTQIGVEDSSVYVGLWDDWNYVVNVGQLTSMDVHIEWNEACLESNISL